MSEHTSEPETLYQPSDELIRCLGLGIEAFIVLDTQRPEQRMVYFEDRTAIQLSPTHYPLLAVLTQRPNEIIGRSQLIAEAGLSDRGLGPRLTNTIGHMRRYLGQTPSGVSRRDMVRTITTNSGPHQGLSTNGYMGVLEDFTLPGIEWLELTKQHLRGEGAQPTL